MCFQRHLIQELTDKVDRLEMQRLSTNMFFKGIEEEENEVCTITLKNFLKNKLKIETNVQLQDAFRIGKAKPHTILAKLANVKDKGKIFAHVHNLQEVKNKDGKRYKIDAQLPPRHSAAKQKQRHIMWRNKTKVSTAHRLELSVKKGKLMIGNEEYAQKIVVPNDKVLIKLKKEEVEELNRLEICKGKPIEEGG